MPLRSQLGMGMMKRSSWVRLCEAARRSRARCSSLWQEPWGWGREDKTAQQRRKKWEDKCWAQNETGAAGLECLEAGKDPVRWRQGLRLRGH